MKRETFGNDGADVGIGIRKHNKKTSYKSIRL